MRRPSHVGRLTLLAALALSSASRAQNVLLLIADDVGVDRVAVYGASPDPGRTPHLDALAHRGRLFRRAWSNPYCSPTRATILTGRYGFRTGVGSNLAGGFDSGSGGGDTIKSLYSLPAGERSLPEVLRRGSGGSIATVVLGKWHLAEGADAATHPLLSGFDHHAGSLANLDFKATPPETYDDWEKIVDGVAEPSLVYATTDTVDDAVLALDTLPEPWFLWVAFNAAHAPFHAPPDHLHGVDLDGVPAGAPGPHFKAAVEALDTEIGRLLRHLDARPELVGRTTVVFVGDNGTPKKAKDTDLPGKGSLYEGGVHVPLIVAGPRVAAPGRESAALVHTADLYATVLELAGVPPPAGTGDSVSLVPYLDDPDASARRAHVFAEKFAPNGFGPREYHHVALRGERYKLIRALPDGTEKLFDLEADPTEQTNLMHDELTPAAAAARAELTAALRDLLGS